jgi:urea transporter
MTVPQRQLPANMAGKLFPNAIVVGTILQLAMVLAGHWVEPIKSGFAVGGMAISALAGVMYGRAARLPRGQSAVNGGIAGAACALVGIAVSFFMHDTAAMILIVGTIGSFVTGAIGGAIAGGVR